MVIVGVSGNIGSGKTTFSKLLGDASGNHRHGESSDIIIEVANLLKALPHPDQASIEHVNGWLKSLPDILEEVTHTRVKSIANRLNGRPTS